MNNNEMIRKINKSEKDIVKVNEQLDTKAKQSDLEIERNRINNIVALPQSVDNAETADIRVGQMVRLMQVQVTQLEISIKEH